MPTVLEDLGGNGDVNNHCNHLHSSFHTVKDVINSSLVKVSIPSLVACPQKHKSWAEDTRLVLPSSSHAKVTALPPVLQHLKFP